MKLHPKRANNDSYYIVCSDCGKVNDSETEPV